MSQDDNNQGQGAPSAAQGTEVALGKGVDLGTANIAAAVQNAVSWGSRALPLPAGSWRSAPVPRCSASTPRTGADGFAPNRAAALLERRYDQQHLVLPWAAQCSCMIDRSLRGWRRAATRVAGRRTRD